MTTNVIIAFGGVFLLGMIAAVLAWVAGAALQHKERPSQGETQSNTQPGSH